jgi:hypothetical protein
MCRNNNLKKKGKENKIKSEKCNIKKLKGDKRHTIFMRRTELVSVTSLVGLASKGLATHFASGRGRRGRRGRGRRGSRGRGFVATRSSCFASGALRWR